MALVIQPINQDAGASAPAKAPRLYLGSDALYTDLWHWKELERPDRDRHRAIQRNHLLQWPGFTERWGRNRDIPAGDPGKKVEGRWKQMKGHGEKFGRKKEQAIAALLTATTATEAARVCGIGETTLWRWLQDVEFAERYRQARKRALDVAISRLNQIATDAVNTLHEVITNREAPTSSRVAAARVILETAIKAVEMEEIEARLETLEESTLKKGRR